MLFLSTITLTNTMEYLLILPALESQVFKSQVHEYSKWFANDKATKINQARASF